MKKGFTLVELLGVIVILGVLALIATNVISNTLNETKDDLYEIQISSIIAGAKTWASSNIFELPENDNEFIIVTLRQLKEGGFVDQNISNPKTEEQFSNDLEIKITKVGNNYTYEIVE